MLSLGFVLAALLHLAYAATVTQVRVKTGITSGSESNEFVLFETWLEGTVYSCTIRPPARNTEFTCTPQAVGKDCDNIGDYPQMKITNNKLDAAIFQYVSFTTSDGTTYTATGFCADATVYATMLSWPDTYVADGSCADGDRKYRDLCVDIDHCGLTSVIFEFDSTTVTEASLELAQSVTYDALSTTCGCGDFGAANGHVCTCQDACGTDYCNSADFVAGRLKVDGSGAICKIGKCCCSCPNCPNFIQPVS